MSCKPIPFIDALCFFKASDDAYRCSSSDARLCLCPGLAVPQRPLHAGQRVLRGTLHERARLPPHGPGKGFMSGRGWNQQIALE